MSGFNIAAKSKEEQDKVAVDLVASGVAYKERLAMPVVAELVAREQPEHLREYLWNDCGIIASSVRSCRTKMPRNMQKKRMR
ncbi:DNA polymerase III, theta subunit [Escherichia coli]|nr:DNA polymerase III, theta subunit [Escherichia coli]OXZ81353.1 DNA polymerase III, theta subunit [Escherichia coli]